MSYTKNEKKKLFPGIKRRKERPFCGFYRHSPTIPPIIEQTCIYLEQNALLHEGLFRVSGSSEDVKHFKEKFDKGKRVDFSKEKNPNTVAGVLKAFFTDLPNPVLTYELYPSFMAAVSLTDPRLWVWSVRKVVDSLPPGNRAVINRVCATFRTLTFFEKDNKMSAKNIALVMNPSMFREKDSSMMSFVQSGALRVRLVELLINNHKELFETPMEVLDQQIPPYSTLEPEIQLQLDKFTRTLRENAIILAGALIGEGETELTVKFDDVRNLHKTLSAPAEDIPQRILEKEKTKESSETTIRQKHQLSKTPKSRSQILPKYELLSPKGTRAIVINGDEEDGEKDQIESQINMLRFRSNSSPTAGLNLINAHFPPQIVQSVVSEKNENHSEEQTESNTKTLTEPPTKEQDPVVPLLRANLKRRKQKNRRDVRRDALNGSFDQVSISDSNQETTESSQETIESTQEPPETSQDTSDSNLNQEDEEMNTESNNLPMYSVSSFEDSENKSPTTLDSDFNAIVNNAIRYDTSPEDIAKLFFSICSGNPNIVRQVLESLPEESRKHLGVRLKSVSVEMIRVVEQCTQV